MIKKYILPAILSINLIILGGCGKDNPANHRGQGSQKPGSSYGQDLQKTKSDGGQGSHEPGSGHGQGLNRPEGGRGQGLNRPEGGRGLGLNRPEGGRGQGLHRPEGGRGQGLYRPEGGRGLGSQNHPRGMGLGQGLNRKGKGNPMGGEENRLRRYRNRQEFLEPQTITLSEQEKNQVQFETVTVEEKPVQATLKAMGKVLAPIDGQAVVGYAFPGRVIKFEASLGQWVKTGAPLVTLECEAAGSARSDYLKALTEFQLAQQNFQREERLQAKDIGAKKDFLESKAQLDIAASNLDAAEKKLVVMGFSKKQVQELKDAKNITPYVTVKAPIDGKVIRVNAVLGAMIEPATEIMTLLNSSRLCIDAEIYEKDLARIKLQQEVRIAVPAYPEETFTGRISYIGDTVHPETRTITVRTLVPNKDFKLKPGMFADIAIQLDRREKALTLPIAAILDNLDQKIVFTRENGSFTCKTVEVGVTFNGYIEIKKGLVAGETVVVQGNYQLKSKLYEQTLHEAHVH